MATVVTLIKSHFAEMNQSLYVKKFYVKATECNISNIDSLLKAVNETCESLSPCLGYKFHIKPDDNGCHIKAIKILPKGCVLYQHLKVKNHSDRECQFN